MRNLFELQKEVKSSGSLLKQNFLQTRHKRNGGMTLIYRTPVRPGLVGFCLSLGIVLILRGSKFIQMKFHGTCLVKKTDSYRFHLSSWTRLTICLKIVLIPRGSKFIQMKFHGTCLVKQTDFYRPHCFVLDFSSIREIYQHKFVRLFVQVKISATSLDRQRSYDANIAPCSRHSVSV